jgi:hypothetical protein
MTSKPVKKAGTGRPRKDASRKVFGPVTVSLPPKYGTYPKRKEPELIRLDDGTFERSVFAVEDESVETTEQRMVLFALNHALSDVTHSKRLPERLTDSLLQFYRQRMKQLGRLASTNEIQKLARQNDTVNAAGEKVAEKRGSADGEDMKRIRLDVLKTAKGKPRASRAKPK